MNESFETRLLLERETLKSLQQRQNLSSVVRLTLQLGAFFLCVWLVILSAPFPVVAACLTVVLGAIWASKELAERLNLGWLIHPTSFLPLIGLVSLPAAQLI